METFLTGDRPIAKSLTTQDNTTHRNADITMLPTGFELKIPLFERSKALAPQATRPGGRSWWVVHV